LFVFQEENGCRADFHTAVEDKVGDLAKPAAVVMDDVQPCVDGSEGERAEIIRMPSSVHSSTSDWLKFCKITGTMLVFAYWMSRKRLAQTTRTSSAMGIGNTHAVAEHKDQDFALREPRMMQNRD
jgi:hypothetical protein